MRRVTHDGDGVWLQVKRGKGAWVTVVSMSRDEVDWRSCLEWLSGVERAA